MEQKERLAVGEQARSLAAALLAPPGGTWIAPVLWLGRLTTLGLLPETIRDRYGFAWRTRDSRRLRSAAAVLCAARRILPPVLREWPAAREADRARRA